MVRELTSEKFSRYCDNNPIERVEAEFHEVNFYFKNGHHICACPDINSVMNYQFVTEISDEDYEIASD